MKARKTSAWVAVVTALVPALAWIAMAGNFSIEGGDFPATYTGAALAKQGQFASLHDVALQAKVQAFFTPKRSDTVFFVRPHVYAALLAPLAWLSLRGAFFAMAAVQGTLLVLLGVWAYRRFGGDALILLACFPPAILGIAFGQDPVLYLALGVASYVLYERGHFLCAGLVLGCALIKPHLLLLFPLTLILQKRWRMLAGFALGGALEATLSLLLGGMKGASGYLAFLRKQQGYLTPNPEHMINLQGMMESLDIHQPFPLVAQMLLVAAVIACVSIIALRGAWWQGLAAAQVGTAMIAPHVFMYDSTIVVLPALLIYFHTIHFRTRAAAAFFLMPVAYLLQLADKPWTILPSLAVLGLLVALLFDAPLLRQTNTAFAPAN